ncbi:hypothetical protein [Treponema sp.]|uniref:hypothetical protein n=1 Tax=Treponema sp. TaxID=166 RepID=UPI00388F9682
MKKIVGTIAAIALATSAVFADVNVGMGFSRAIFTPFAYDGSDARMDISTSWGATPRIGASISGASEDCGVVGDFKFDGGEVTVNDNAYVWVKPISWLKLNIGQSFDDTLRGNACFGTWDWLRIGAALTGEDFTFTRICGNPLSGAYAPLVGAILMADPIEGLHIGVSFPIYGKTFDDTDDDGTPDAWVAHAYTNSKMEDVFSTMQVAAGYTIDGVGTIKAQWIGAGKDAEDKVQGQIEAAFDLKAVEDMKLEIGAKFRTVEDSPIDVAAYWSMPFDALRVHVSAGLTYAPKVFGDDAVISLVLGAAVDYDLGNGVGITADVRFGQSFCSADGYDSDPAIGVGAWVNKGIANGTVGIGAQFTNKTNIRDFPQADDINFAIPVRVQCFF